MLSLICNDSEIVDEKKNTVSRKDVVKFVAYSLGILFIIGIVMSFFASSNKKDGTTQKENSRENPLTISNYNKNNKTELQDFTSSGGESKHNEDPSTNDNKDDKKIKSQDTIVSSEKKNKQRPGANPSVNNNRIKIELQDFTTSSEDEKEKNDLRAELENLYEELKRNRSHTDANLNEMNSRIDSIDNELSNALNRSNRPGLDNILDDICTGEQNLTCELKRMRREFHGDRLCSNIAKLNSRLNPENPYDNRLTKEMKANVPINDRFQEMTERLPEIHNRSLAALSNILNSRLENINNRLNSVGDRLDHLSVFHFTIDELNDRVDMLNNRLSILNDIGNELSTLSDSTKRISYILGIRLWDTQDRFSKLHHTTVDDRKYQLNEIRLYNLRLENINNGLNVNINNPYYFPEEDFGSETRANSLDNSFVDDGNEIVNDDDSEVPIIFE